MPLERPDDPPGTPARATAKTMASSVTFGRFTSIQVNVTAAGANIVGDAANEPTIAVDPTNHNRMVIGWHPTFARRASATRPTAAPRGWRERSSRGSSGAIRCWA